MVRVQSVGLDVRRFLISSHSLISALYFSPSSNTSPSSFVRRVKGTPASIHCSRTYLRDMIKRPRAPTLDVEIPSLPQRIILADQDLFIISPQLSFRTLAFVPFIPSFPSILLQRTNRKRVCLTFFPPPGSLTAVNCSSLYF